MSVPRYRVVFVLALWGVTTAAFSAGWPDRPITIVVHTAAGGASDLVARIVAKPLTAALGAQVIVENRPGANGAIGYNYVSKAPPEGYVFGTATEGVTIQPYMRAFDPRQAFQAVGRMTTQPLVLAVHTSVPARNVKELVALGKAKAGMLSFVSSGTGTSQHLTGELLQRLAGFQMTHIPYKGGGQAINDLAAGHVPVGVLGSSTVIPHTRTGRLRILAVTSAERSSLLPEVPTLSESGFPQIDVFQWIGLVAPAGTPQTIVQRVNDEVGKALNSEDIRRVLLNSGLEAAPGSMEAMRKRIAEEVERWGRVIETYKIDVKAS
jgi:tripartite-type tricarboxylate transporter receptor subunit TctC